MNKVRISILTAAVFGVTLTATPLLAQQAAEVGYEPGALGVSAILDGNYAGAAQRLASLDGATKGDPARLINLGNAYAGMGRSADAEAAYRAAREAMPVDLIMADGSIKTSREVAREGLRRLRISYAAR